MQPNRWTIGYVTFEAERLRREVDGAAPYYVLTGRIRTYLGERRIPYWLGRILARV